MIKVDVDFQKWLHKWDAAEVQVFVVSEKVLKQVATLLYTKIVSYTPVGDPSLWSYKMPAGYHPGTLKKSWKIDYQPRIITITNQQPYALRVENGWSTQAPYGMMRIAIKDFPDLLAQAAARYKL